MNNIQKAEAQIVVVINHEFQCVQEASITIISFVTLGDLAGRSNKKNRANGKRRHSETWIDCKTQSSGPVTQKLNEC